jgi:hypothetical protein
MRTGEQMNHGRRAGLVAAAMALASGAFAVSAQAAPALPHASVHVRRCDPAKVNIAIRNTTQTRQQFRIIDEKKRRTLIKFDAVAPGAKDVVSLPRDVPWKTLGGYDTILVRADFHNLALTPLASIQECGDVRAVFTVFRGRRVRVFLRNGLDRETSFRVLVASPYGLVTKWVHVRAHSAARWSNTYRAPMIRGYLSWHGHVQSVVDRGVILP